MNDSIKLRPKLPEKLLKTTLLKGTCIACLGALILLICATSMPPQTLSSYGPFLFSLSITLIATGLIPYKKLQKTQHSFLLLTQESLHWKHQNTITSIPYTHIESLNYAQHTITLHTHTSTLRLPYFSSQDFEELASIVKAHS